MMRKESQKMHQILMLEMEPEDIEELQENLAEILKWFEDSNGGPDSGPAVNIESIRFLHDWLKTAYRYESLEI